MTEIENNYWESAPERWLLPSIYRQLAEIMGWDEAVRVGLSIWLSSWPRGKSHGSWRACAYIPKKFNENAPPPFTELIGAESTKILISEFPGLILEFHGIGEATLWRRNAGVVEQSKVYRQSAIAARFGITERTVRRIIASAK